MANLETVAPLTAAPPVKIMEDVVEVSLGDGTTTNRSTAVKIMDNVAEVSLGDVHSAAVKIDGSLWTWGVERNWQTRRWH